MDLQRRLLLFMAVTTLCAAGLTSCDDDDETTSESLSGEFTYEIPDYVEPGQVLPEIDPRGMMYKGDHEAVGYYWKMTPGMSAADTVWTEDAVKNASLPGTFTVIVPDTLTTLTITCYAFASGYYSSSKTDNPVVVDHGMPSLSITFNDAGANVNFPLKSDGKFTDPRDGYTYYTTKVNGTEWMKQNLAYEGLGRGRSNCDAASTAFGRYYTWEEALEACPDGWRLASDSDWVELAEYISPDGTFEPLTNLEGVAGPVMGQSYFNGEKMWEFSRNVKITEDSILSAIPAGYATVGSYSSSFSDLNEFAAFWTSDEADTEAAYCRYVYQDNADIFIGSLDKKSFGASVRCVR